jgi:small subunit ribosomal protein S21
MPRPVMGMAYQAYFVFQRKGLQKIEKQLWELLDRGGEFNLTQVILKPGESQDSLLRRFRKKVTRERILSDVKKKRFFMKKSEERQRARRKAVRKEQQRLRREQRRRY